MNSRKKIALLSLFLCFSLLSGLFVPLPVAAEEALPDLSRVDAVLLYHMDSGKTVMEKNASKVIYPASTVKIMTGLLAAEALAGRRQEKITVTRAMIDASSGFRMYLNEGEVVTVEQMLYAAIAGSYNDACIVLAFAVAGSVQGFVRMMNERAKLLGATSTFYTNPTGMHEAAMVTTAADTAHIALAALENEVYREICGTAKYTMAATNLSTVRGIYNRNALISKHITAQYYNSAVYGLNAGTTTEGGFCVVSAAEKGGLGYLCVVMGGQENEQTNTAYSVTNALYAYVYAHYANYTLISPDTVLAQFPVDRAAGKSATVGVYAKETLDAYLPSSLDMDKDLSYRYLWDGGELSAPLNAHEKVGLLTVAYGEEVLGTVEVYAAADVAPDSFLVGLEHLSDYTSGRPFRLACLYAVILLVVYFVLWPLYRRRRSRKRARFF